MDALNIINEGISNCIFIVSEDFKLQGLVTDGDIRRGLLRGLVLGDSILEVLNDDPVVDVGAKPTCDGCGIEYRRLSDSQTLHLSTVGQLGHFV